MVEMKKLLGAPTKINIVPGRVTEISKCCIKSCNNKDEFFICVGSEARLSTLVAFVCRKHINYAVIKIFNGTWRLE